MIRWAHCANHTQTIIGNTAENDFRKIHTSNNSESSIRFIAWTPPSYPNPKICENFLLLPPLNMSWCYDESYGHAIYDSNATYGSNPLLHRSPRNRSPTSWTQSWLWLEYGAEGCVYDSMANGFPPGEHSEANDLITLHPLAMSIMCDIWLINWRSNI